MFCKNCGKEVDGSSNFCEECGSHIKSSNERQDENLPSEYFCPNCGSNRVEKKKPPVPSAGFGVAILCLILALIVRGTKILFIPLTIIFFLMGLYDYFLLKSQKEAKANGTYKWSMHCNMCKTDFSMTPPKNSKD